MRTLAVADAVGVQGIGVKCERSVQDETAGSSSSPHGIAPGTSPVMIRASRSVSAGMMLPTPRSALHAASVGAARRRGERTERVDDNGRFGHVASVGEDGPGRDVLGVHGA